MTQIIRRDNLPDTDKTSGVILYVGSRLPALSETFVYREMLGLRSLGRPTLAASLHTPRRLGTDPALAALAAETFVIYSFANLLKLPKALLRHPRQLVIATGEAFRADHPSLRSRCKHIVQAGMGIVAAHELRGRHIGHVHAHMANAPTMVALYIARTLEVPFSFTGHAADLFVERAALAFKLQHTSFVACISRWHRDFYRSIVPLDARRLPLVRCSVAIPDAVREERKIIVVVARLIPKKGIDLLIRAFAATEALSGWTLQMLGDGPERAGLERRAQELEVRDRVEFFGARSHAECLDAIACAGIVALPCRTASNGDKDGIPVVLMEAMAAARALIAGDLPAIRELIDDGETGLLVPPDDEVRLGAALAQLASDPALRVRLGAAARSKVATEFSDQINWQRLTAALDLARANPLAGSTT